MPEVPIGQRLDVGGIELAYEVHGSGGARPMVLLHALGERGRSWEPVLPALGERYETYTFDLRGHGDSSRTGDYSFDAMYGDVAGALDVLGLDDVVLIGHSMGAVVAYLLAIRQPARVGCLVVEDGPPPFPRTRTLPERPAAELDFDWAAVACVIGAVNRGDPWMWDNLPTIKAPTLVIGGGPQSHVPQDKLVEVASRVPRATLVTIPAGHDVHTDRPDEFARLVLGWLDGYQVDI